MTHRKTNTNSHPLYTHEEVVRIIAAQVVLLTTLALVTHWIPIIIFLVIDFLIRAFTYQTSPLAAVGKLAVHLLKRKPQPIYLPPKKFAAGIGFVFSVAILILFLFKWYLAAYLIGGTLIFCAVLESVFKICLGCYAYNWLFASISNKRREEG